MPDIEQPEQTDTMDLAAAQRVEQEKLTRRAALRKLGFGAGMAAFAMLGVDDMARMVGQRMERMAGDNKVAEQVAKEFQNAGIVMADGPLYYYTPSCQHCSNQYFLDNCYCDSKYGPAGTNPNPSFHQTCSNQATANNSGCVKKNCFGDEPSNNNGPICPASLQPPQGCLC